MTTSGYAVTAWGSIMTPVSLLLYHDAILSCGNTYIDTLSNSMLTSFMSTVRTYIAICKVLWEVLAHNI